MPVAIDGTAADEGLTCDFRRVEMRSFTVGAASLLFVELVLDAVAGDCRDGWTVL